MHSLTNNSVTGDTSRENGSTRQIYVIHTISLARASNDRMADAKVKSRWVEQGIWTNAWNSKASDGLWKHEEPLLLESESETDSEQKARLRTLVLGGPWRLIGGYRSVKAGGENGIQVTIDELSEASGRV